MPRLTLSMSEQMDLHQYYQTLNTGTNTDLIKTRRAITSGSSSLPQRAGRAYSQLLLSYAGGAEILGVEIGNNLARSVPLVSRAYSRYKKLQCNTAQKNPPGRKVTKGQYKIEALMHPNPDLKALAKALLILAMDEKRKNNNKKSSTSDVPEAAPSL